MFLSSLINKRIIANHTPRGICVGVGISKKDGAVKYLCCSETHNEQARFFVPFRSISAIDNEALITEKLRVVFPAKCLYLYLGLPVYTLQGVLLGTLENAQWENGMLSCLTVDGKTLPFSIVYAVQNIILVQPTIRFPLGQRIPAPFLEKNNRSPIITKRFLKESVQSGTLIRLTLSLPPFNAL